MQQGSCPDIKTSATCQLSYFLCRDSCQIVIIWDFVFYWQSIRGLLFANIMSGQLFSTELPVIFMSRATLMFSFAHIDEGLCLWLSAWNVPTVPHALWCFISLCVISINGKVATSYDVLNRFYHSFTHDTFLFHLLLQHILPPHSNQHLPLTTFSFDLSNKYCLYQPDYGLLEVTFRCPLWEAARA